MSRPFPSSRTEYTFPVGALRVDNISSILTRLGFRVHAENVRAHDVDVWVYDETDTLVLVIEVTNWQTHIYMPSKKARSIRVNFRRYHCFKLFVCSSRMNYFQYEEYLESDVDVIEIGFQTLFPSWYERLLELNDVHDRRPLDTETQEIVERNLRTYLTEKGLL